jgi:hypothetical protein
MKLASSGPILEIYSCIKCIKNCPAEAELFHVDGQTDRPTDGQTDMMKVIITFHKLWRMPLNTARDLAKIRSKAIRV